MKTFGEEEESLRQNIKENETSFILSDRNDMPEASVV